MDNQPKPLFELDSPTPADTRAAFASGLAQVAEALLDGTDGGPQDMRLEQAVVILDYENGTRAVALAQDSLDAYHMAYHAIRRSLCKEMLRRAQAGEELRLCGDLRALFEEYLGEQGIVIEYKVADGPDFPDLISMPTAGSYTKH